MDIDVKCAACGEIQVIKIPVPEDKAFYQVEDKYFDENKRSKRKCKVCKEKQLYYYVDENRIPGTLGGNKNYMSMDRYWAQNKGEVRRQEDSLAKKMAERHTERVTYGSDKRHQGYGKGQGEQKLSSD